MTPEQQAGRLESIAEQVDLACHLVDCGELAARSFQDGHDGEIMRALLGEVAERLIRVAAELRTKA